MVFEIFVEEFNALEAVVGGLGEFCVEVMGPGAAEGHG